MAWRDKTPTSAQVVLRSASGTTADARTAITSENVSEYAPSAADAARVRDIFERAGFTVGSLVGNSFSITGPAAAFERYFGVKLLGGSKGVKAKGRGENPSYELPVSGLPAEIANRILAVMFTPAPDFGPSDY